MRQTTNYKLPSWDSDDRILRTDFNDLTDKTDKALNANAQAISDEISARESAISTEAEARTGAVATLTAKLEEKGNCIVSYVTYRGDGNGSHTLTFSHRPILVVIMQDNVLFVAVQGSPAALSRNAGTSGGAKPTLTWSGNSVSWTGSSSSSLTCDDSGVTYHVAALLEA